MTSSDICEVSLSLRPKIGAQTCLPFAGQRYASSALPRYASRPTEVPCYNWLRRDAPRGCKYRKQLECLQGETVKIRAGTISFHTGKGQHGLFRDQTGCIISKGGKCQDTVQTRPQGSLNRLLGILRIIRLVVIQKAHFYLIERKYNTWIISPSIWMALQAATLAPDYFRTISTKHNNTQQNT